MTALKKQKPPPDSVPILRAISWSSFRGPEEVPQTVGGTIMGSPFVRLKTVLVSRPPPCFCVLLGLRVCRRPGPSSAPLPVPVLLPSLLAQLSAPSSTASALLMLHVPLQLSLLPLGLLLCRLVCFGKKSPLEEGDPGERPAEARPQGFSRAGPTPSVLARPL